MGNFLDSLRTFSRDALCTSLGLQTNYYGYVGRYAPNILVGTAADAASAYFGAAYRIFCDQEPPATPAPQFSGGQCPVTYSVTGTLFFQPSPGAGIIEFPLAGNVGGPIREFKMNFTPPPDATVTVVGVRATDNVEFSIGGGSNGDPVQPIGEDTDFTILTVNRVDGLPDDCGDPEPPIPDPEPGFNESMGNITYVDSNGDNQIVPINLTFGSPFSDSNGDLNVPVRIQLGDNNVNINGNLNLNEGDINLNFDNPNYNKGGKPLPGDYDTEEEPIENPPGIDTPVEPGNPEENEADTVKVIRACIVTISEIGPGTSIIYQDNNPDLLIPDAGSIAFQVVTARDTAWTSDIPVRNRKNFIAVPWDAGAVAVRGTPRVGVTWTITPVYGLVDEQITFTF